VASTAARIVAAMCLDADTTALCRDLDSKH
jgi:hypothetical protein